MNTQTNCINPHPFPIPGVCPVLEAHTSATGANIATRAPTIRATALSRKAVSKSQR